MASMSSLSSKTGCVFGAERVYIAKEVVVLSDYYYSTTYIVYCAMLEKDEEIGEHLAASLLSSVVACLSSQFQLIRESRSVAHT